ncbi:MAG: DUF5615 family PIN-like protein [Thermoguttaceae bacterium]|jgi:hypothetical protein
MLRFIADENFNNHILRGLLRRNAQLDIVRVQDLGPGGAEDAAILAWAAEHGRVLLTHDAATVPGVAGQRVEEGRPMPGVVVAPRRVPIGQAIDAILLLAECSHEDEWEGMTVFLPF